MTTIGVLALQGDFAEHGALLRQLGAKTRQVRLAENLVDLDGLIIPGGETTTFDLLLSEYGLVQPIQRAALAGIPIWGTCAGLIALAKHVFGRAKPLIGALNITVKRNAYGRQVDSFESSIHVPAFGDKGFQAIFIRAPKIEAVGPDVAVIASLTDGSPVAVRQDSIIGTTFHPELTADVRFHAYFLNLVKKAAQGDYATLR